MEGRTMNPALRDVQEALLRAGVHTVYCDEPQPDWEFLRVHGSSGPVPAGAHNTILFIPTAEPDTLTLRSWVTTGCPAPPHQDTRFSLKDRNMYGKLLRAIIAVDPYNE